MLIMITGGSGSGKSEFAEQCCMALCPGPKIYIATMQPFGTEGAKRIQRHRNLRAGRKFRTVECYTDLEMLDLKDVLQNIRTDSASLCTETDENAYMQLDKTNPVVLLECLSNLAANEMFGNALGISQTVEKILDGISNLRRQAKHLVVVTNDVFRDGITYEKETVHYMQALGKANMRLARMADIVYEVVCGIPVLLKGEAQMPTKKPETETSSDEDV